jgi:prolyl-tRNA synthetase
MIGTTGCVKSMLMTMMIMNHHRHISKMMMVRSFSTNAFTTTTNTNNSRSKSMIWTMNNNNKNNIKKSSRSGSRMWMSSSSSSSLDDLIEQKGNEIRELKANGKTKAEVAPYVQELLALKEQRDGPPKAPAAPKKKKKKKAAATAVVVKPDSDWITPREEDYSKWYNDLIRVAGMAEQSPVRGCMIIKPWGMSVWDAVKRDLDGRIVEKGAENVYFPLLIPKSFLTKEAEHVEGFAKECAVITHHRLVDDGTGNLIEDPTAKLVDPLIVRPTSETMIWNTFRDWIVSWRDLPLKVNQWANVMRWEMRTRPFLRTSEFLWQEGHTAHVSREEAYEEAKTMIGVYEQMCRDMLAMPTMVGVKSPSERFAGAEETFTIEALMPNGWALQSGTSHFLGQSFGKAFDVTYQTSEGTDEIVWGTSWGVSTRLIGALIMTHSDNAGLVLPPRIAPIQVVIVPLGNVKKMSDEETQTLQTALDNLTNSLKAQNIRYKIDDRDYVRPGAKYFEWERKGVPLRIELGPRDIAKNTFVVAHRDPTIQDKEFIPLNFDTVGHTIHEKLENFQQKLLEQAQERLASNVHTHVTNYDDMKAALINDEASSYPGSGLYLVPWHCNADNEDAIQKDCKATIRCYPSATQDMAKDKTCFYSGKPATHMALFGRAF